MTGWIPDALIPTNATHGVGGFPLDVEANQNQGFWIDVHLPRDQENFTTGIYNSKIQVLQQGKVIKEIPVEVTLLPQYLPDEDHSIVWLFTEDVYAYYPGLSEQEIDAMLKFEGHRHRIQVVGGFDVNKSSFNNESLKNTKVILMALPLLLLTVIMALERELVKKFFQLECMAPGLWATQRIQFNSRRIYG